MGLTYFWSDLDLVFGGPALSYPVLGELVLSGLDLLLSGLDLLLGELVLGQLVLVDLL
jgi:hypothetical protein